MIQRALTTLALNQRSSFFKPHLTSCADMDKWVCCIFMFQGSYSQLNCSSGFPRSLNELPRQLVIRKLAAISWWKARDRTPQQAVLFPALITALQAAPFADSLRNCFSVLVKSASWCLFSGDCCSVPAQGVLRGKGFVFSTCDLRYNPLVLVLGGFLFDFF